MENKGLQTQNSGWSVLKEQATMLLKTGFLPTSLNTVEKVLAVVLTGRELNLPMMEALRGINIIQGKPSVSPQTMLALANRTGQLEDIKIQADIHVGACVTIKRKGREPHTEIFGAKEAAALGLDSKDNYKKQPVTMYKWRALAANLRVTFPDAISGLYTPDELGAEVKIGEDETMTVVDVKTGEITDQVTKVTDTEISSKNGLPAPKEATPEKVSDSEFSHYLDKMLKLALPMCGGDQKLAEVMILDATEFAATEDKTTKEGKKIKKGAIVRAKDFGHLSKSTKWTQSTYGRIKKDYESWMKNQIKAEEPIISDDTEFVLKEESNIELPEEKIPF